VKRFKVFASPTSFQKAQNRVARELLESRADVTFNDLGVPLKGEQIVERMTGMDGYIAGLDYVTRDVVERMPESVKVISRYGIGVDRVDLDACHERGIVVTNTPGANATAVCELAFALMLSLARSVPELNEAVKRGEWPRSEGIELAGRTLGVVGFGMIGRKLAFRARAFEMEVLAYDPYFDKAFAAMTGARLVSLDELFTASDFVSLHLPYDEQTRHIVDAARIVSMKRGAILINTARGGLIDEAAAAEALKSGQLGGLGLDAFEQEPPADSPLIGLPRVVMTPHTGAQTAEAVAGMGMMAVHNLLNELDGGESPHRVVA
jgi:D-3-phosphoglycerate dehydrogenase